MPYCRDCGTQVYDSDTYCSSCKDDIVSRSCERIRDASDAEKRRIRADDDYCHTWLQNLIGWIVNLIQLISTIKSGAGCYITSSVVAFLELPDDGLEMTLFRQFRERYIIQANCPERNSDLVEYYLLGLRLRNWINSRHDSEAIWKFVSVYVLDTLDLIKGGSEREAYIYFKNRTLNLEMDILAGKHVPKASVEPYTGPRGQRATDLEMSPGSDPARPS